MSSRSTKVEARQLYEEWQEAKAEEDEAASVAAKLAFELAENYGVDVDDPPIWINEE